jgi:hypothetical protein
MRMFWSGFAAVAAVALLVGNVRAADNALPDKLKEALEKSTVFELYSLEPTRKLGNDFQFWKSLGSVIIADPATLSKITKALEAAVDEQKGNPAGEFVPRHGLRVAYDGKAYDIVISFDTNQAQAFYADKRANFQLSKAAQPLLDQLLMDAKIALGQRDRVGIPKEANKKADDPLPGFPNITYSASVLEVVGHDNRQLLKIIKVEPDQDKKQIVWLLQALVDISYEDYVAIRNAWENGAGPQANKGPSAHFFDAEKVSLYTRDLKEEGKLRNAKKGDCIRLILDVGDGFPKAASMEIRQP